jgi:hypothetical protein
MKKINTGWKKYRVVCRLTQYAYHDIEAPSKQSAKEAAYEADRRGKVEFGSDAEFDVVEVQLDTRRKK